MDQPPPEITLLVNTSSKDTVSRLEEARFQVRPHPKDSGIIFWDRSGYWANLSLTGAKALVAWLTTWCNYQSERFKPTGFKLVSLVDGTEKTVPDGTSVVLIGDSFFIKGQSGEQLSEAFPALTWSIAPIFSEV